MNREQQLPQQGTKIQNIIEQDEKISLSNEKLNMNSNLSNLQETLEPTISNNEEVLVHPPPNGMCTDDDILVVDEGAVLMSSPKIGEKNASKKSISGSANTGLSQSDLSVSSSTGSNQGYCYGSQESYTVEAKGYQSSSPQQNNLENPVPAEDDEDETDAVPDYIPNSKPVITAAIYKQDPDEIIITTHTQVKVVTYENDTVDAENVDKEPIIEEDEEENLSEKEENSVIQQDENAVSDDEKVEENIIEEKEGEKYEEVNEDGKETEDERDDDDVEDEDEEDIKSVVEEKDEVDTKNEIQPIKAQEEQQNDNEQFQLGNGIRVDLKCDNGNSLPETNGNHHNEENGCTDLTETTNDFDSLLNLPEPPTCDEIKHLNDISGVDNLDSLPPPPPIEVAAGGPTNGES